MIDDLRETFANLRRFRIKLNPAKCTFGVPAGKLLGFLVSSRGIEANPKKIRAIESMKLPEGLSRDVQKFTGCLGILEQIRQSAGRKSNATVPADEEIRCIPMDTSGRCSVP